MAKFITKMFAGVRSVGFRPRIRNTIQLPPIANTPMQQRVFNYFFYRFNNCKLKKKRFTNNQVQDAE